MPHFTVEYAEAREIEERVADLLEALAAAAKASPIVNFPGLKLRAIPLRHYRVGGEIEPFVHVSIVMMDGPALTEREKLSHAVFAGTAEALPFVDQVTVEVRTTEPATYRKRWNQQ